MNSPLNQKITLLPLLVIWAVLGLITYLLFSWGGDLFAYAAAADSFFITAASYLLGAFFYLCSIMAVFITFLAIVFGLGGATAP